ncbi:MAG: hypothetical protein Q9227_008010 [Pyrenula ochraceoflavens]
MSKRLAFTVTGRVQGVNFRAFTSDAAQDKGLSGFVQGEVQGDESSVQKFLKDIGVGPSVAKVDKLEKKDLAVKEGEKGFRVV